MYKCSLILYALYKKLIFLKKYGKKCFQNRLKYSIIILNNNMRECVSYEVGFYRFA